MPNGGRAERVPFASIQPGRSIRIVNSELGDMKMIQPSVIDAQSMAEENSNFRKVLFTGTRTQLVVMALLPGEEIGTEVHRAVDQLLYVVKGRGIAVLSDVEETLGDGAMFCVPAGTTHNVVNTGDEPLKLFTVYSPPQHPARTIHATKTEADAAEIEHAASPVGGNGNHQ
jgi:mannose-6-phosphate isomerase-like protein (cupin superfamily)